ETRYLLQHARIVDDRGMIGSKHRPQLARVLLALGDRLLVEIIAEDIDAVGGGEVVKNVSVEVGQRDAGRGLEESAGGQTPRDIAAELKRRAITLGELQVGDALRSLCAQTVRRRKSLAIGFGETHESDAPLRGDLGRRTVAAKNALFVIFIEGKE